jgi:hypothetical protein
LATPWGNRQHQCRGTFTGKKGFCQGEANEKIYGWGRRSPGCSAKVQHPHEFVRSRSSWANVVRFMSRSRFARAFGCGDRQSTTVLTYLTDWLRGKAPPSLRDRLLALDPALRSTI